MSLAALGNAILFGVVAIALFAIAILLLVRILPGNLWQRATEGNHPGAAIIVAAITLALGWVVAAAFH